MSVSRHDDDRRDDNAATIAATTATKTATTTAAPSAEATKTAAMTAATTETTTASTIAETNSAIPATTSKTPNDRNCPFTVVPLHFHYIGAGLCATEAGGLRFAFAFASRGPGAVIAVVLAALSSRFASPLVGAARAPSSSSLGACLGTVAAAVALA